MINGNSEPIDIQVFDIEKCFDALWVQKCMNDVYETGFDNDKLPLLFAENQHAKIAVKTPTGISKRVSIRNVQGTVWGSLLCTTSMVKLGKHVYEHEDLLYKYKEKVSIPSLGMVDDILAVQKCSEDLVRMNAIINAFIEAKKLTLNKTKCHKIHIQKNSKRDEACHKLKVHNDIMHDSQKEKYLGDIVDKSGKIRNTIEDRRNKGYGTVAEILAIINEIPLGQYKMEIGLKLREAMLINGMLFNSEAWHGVTDTELRILEVVDEHLLRSLVRSRVIDCKSNFKSKYSKEDLLCRICQQEEESQIHLLHCKILNDVLKSNDIMTDQVNYNDIYSDHKKQKVITTIFAKLLEIRKQIVENPENTTNPSNLNGLLTSSYDVQSCIVNYSSGM